VNVKNNKRRKLNDLEKVEQMIAVCELAHEHNLPRKQIAERLRCSEVHVGRILKAAEQRNILETTIRINREHLDQIRVQIISAFGLADARIAPSVTNQDGMREMIGIEAARYFEEVSGDHHAIAISGGRTLLEMVRHLKEKPRKFRIYPMTGLWRDLRIGPIDSGALTFLLWLKCMNEATAYWFPIEPISPTTNRAEVLAHRTTYLANPEVEKTYNAACKVDFAFIGVAALRKESSTIKQVKNIGITYDYLKDLGAVGIAGGVWFDQNGQTVIDDYFLSVPLDTFKKLGKHNRKKAVVVAGGEKKVEPIHVFLKEKLCNVLITDARTAKALLARPENS
jgi:deoxyribonucleoside regulator